MEQTVIGKCPACGGDVIDRPKVFGCSTWKPNDTSSCEFAIWKTMSQRDISKEEALQLMNGEVIGPFEFTSKMGTTFSASVGLEDFRPKFIFADKG